MSTESPSRPKILCVAPAWNEGERIAEVVRDIPAEAVDCIVVVDDGSTDDTSEHAAAAGAVVLHHDRNLGVGAAIRTAAQYGRANGFEVLVVVSGGGKTPCSQISSLLFPIFDGRADFVQGSRYRRGGRLMGAPHHRIWGTVCYTILFSLMSRRLVTDASSGFRAFRLSLFDKKDVNMEQDWLNRYEMEPYLLYKVVRGAGRYVEVPVSITYPPRTAALGYTKMRAFVDWWRIFRPVVFLTFGLKK